MSTTGPKKMTVADHVFAAVSAVKKWDRDWGLIEKELLKNLDKQVDATISVSQKNRMIAAVKIIGKASWLQLKEELY